MEWIAKSSEFAVLKDDKLRDQFPFIDIDSVFFFSTGSVRALVPNQASCPMGNGEKAAGS
jgi:hypothetical protein